MRRGELLPQRQIGTVVGILGVGHGRAHADVFVGVDRKLVRTRVVLERAVALVDVLQRQPDAAHEALGHRAEVHAVAVRFLLRADGEIQGLEREGAAAVERREQIQYARRCGHAEHQLVVSQAPVRAGPRASRAPRGASLEVVARSEFVDDPRRDPVDVVDREIDDGIAFSRRSRPMRSVSSSQLRPGRSDRRRATPPAARRAGGCSTWVRSHACCRPAMLAAAGCRTVLPGEVFMPRPRAPPWPSFTVEGLYALPRHDRADAGDLDAGDGRGHRIRALGQGEAQFVIVAAGRLQHAQGVVVEMRAQPPCARQASTSNCAATPLAAQRWPRSASRPSETSMQAVATPASMRRARSGARQVQAFAQRGIDLATRTPCSSAAAAPPSVPLTHTPSPTRAPSRRSARPGSTKPCTVTAIDSGPRVVSPPTRATPCSSASARIRRGNPPPRPDRRRQRQRQRQRAQAGSAPMAARSDRFTASAFQPTRAASVPEENARLVERVHRHHELHSRRRLQQRGIVADASTTSSRACVARARSGRSA